VLAFELYLKNKNSDNRVVKNPKPIKKIYYKYKSAELDKNEIEYYGSVISKKSSKLQKFLSMPMNNANAELLNLPDERKGTNQANPYLEIYGLFTISRKKERIITLTIGNSSHTVYKASFDLDKNKSSFDIPSDLTLKIDNKSYQIGRKNLFDVYVESKILQKDGSFRGSDFKNICQAFFDFASKRKDILEDEEKSIKTSFSLYVLPNENKITYLDNQKNSEGEYFRDAFGSKGQSYADSPTKTAKFLSYDDLAFTINCTEKEDFYQNLGISKTSLDKINIPTQDVFKISGLSWIFTDVSDPFFHFEETSQGIYTQLYNNYLKLKNKSSIEQDRIQMKVICYKTSQAKLEVLIDENMTMDRMKKLFEKTDGIKSPPSSFEILIDSTGKTTLWHQYLNVIRTLITGVGLDHQNLVSYLNMRLRKRIHSWIKEKSMEPRDFFSRSGFCLLSLSTSSQLKNSLKLEEDYAYKIGKIAGMYVKFKGDVKEGSNSLRDFLTYAKYDREKLRFVLSRVGLGVNLSKAKKESVDKITHYIKDNTPSEEIPDTNAFNDYSYFFYKGVFENIGGT